MSQPSNTPPPINPYDVPERPGMSSGGKVLLGVGIGCGVLLLLCCGGVGLGLYGLGRVAKNSVIEDPKQIEDITDEIVTISVPDSLQPVAGLNVNLPFIGPVGKGAVYSDKDKHNLLIVGQFNEAFADRHNMETQLRASAGQNPDDQLQIKESVSYDTEINGQPAHFTLASGTDRKSADEYFEAVGQFQGKGGPGILILKVRASDFTKDDVMNVIKSMESAPGTTTEEKAEEAKPAEEAPAEEKADQPSEEKAATE